MLVTLLVTALWAGAAHGQPDECRLPAETGNCRAYFPAYYFDAATAKCQSFIYGGCGGNANRFFNATDCHNRCMAGSRAATLARTQSAACRRSRPVSSCPFFGWNVFPTYWFFAYDAASKQCQRHAYCNMFGNNWGNNANAFRSEAECTRACVEPPPTAAPTPVAVTRLTTKAPTPSRRALRMTTQVMARPSRLEVIIPFTRATSRTTAAPTGIYVNPLNNWWRDPRPDVNWADPGPFAQFSTDSALSSYRRTNSPCNGRVVVRLYLGSVEECAEFCDRYQPSCNAFTVSVSACILKGSCYGYGARQPHAGFGLDPERVETSWQRIY